MVLLLQGEALRAALDAFLQSGSLWGLQDSSTTHFALVWQLIAGSALLERTAEALAHTPVPQEVSQELLAWGVWGGGLQRSFDVPPKSLCAPYQE